MRIANKVTDTRSFIEIWDSLPELGHKIILDAMERRKIAKKSVYDWVNGVSPIYRNAEKLQRALLKEFDIKTKVVTLFPPKEERMRLAAEHRAKTEWKGDIDWPRQDDDEEEDQFGL